MSIFGVNGALAGAYQYAASKDVNKADTKGTNFIEQLQETSTSKVDAYTEYLKSKYGKVTIQSIGKDQASLDRAGKSMSGGEVVIAPNIFEQMANDSEKAAYYEQKIDNVFAKIPEYTAYAATQGLTFESCGVIVHEDGTVTYYLSGEESPEKKAKVEAEQKAKQEKKAAQRQENLKRSQEAAEKRRQEMEIAYRKQTMEEVLASRAIESGRVTYAGTPEALRSVVAAYEMSASSIPGILE